jgi:cell division inhibitor SulA
MVMVSRRRPQKGALRERLTDEWLSSKGRAIELGDVVQTKDGANVRIVGRWTKRTRDGNVPVVTGKITKGQHEGRKRGSRVSLAARDVAHVKS